MSPHVGARLHGHGRVVLPFPGYRVERADGDLVLRVEREGANGIVDLRGSQPAIATDLCDVTPGTREGAWRIETSELGCAWPEGFTLAPDPDAMSPFLLLGPEDAMIWLNGPLEHARAKPIEKLAAPGQQVRAVAESADGRAARIDLDYTEIGERWWQRRYVVEWSPGRAVIVSAQARRATEDVVRAAVDLVEQTLVRL